MLYFSNLLSIIYIITGYTGLLPNRTKVSTYAYLFIYLSTIYIWIAPFVGQWVTLLIVLGFATILYFSNRKKLLFIILALTGHLILIFSDYMLTIPLNYFGLSISYLQAFYSIPYKLIRFFIVVTLLSIIKKHIILPRLSIFTSCPDKVLKVFAAELFIGFVLLTFNFVYGDSVSYPTEVLSWNGMVISTLILSMLLVFYSIYDILKRNQELLTAQSQMEIMQNYTRRMESFYEEMRIFRHDYKNILATMQHYIDNGDLNSLQDYYHNRLLPGTDILSDNGFLLGKLHNIEDTAVKSLLYTKLITILNQNISFELELSDYIISVSMDSLSLCRVLGILLDNAIEASLESSEKKLRMAILSSDASIIFIISNSTLPLQVPVSTLSEPGYTTKPEHDGLGLASVARILDTLPQVSLYTAYEENVFRQTLEIAGSN